METDVNILPRDRLLRDTFTPAEWLVFIVVLVSANIVFWFAEPRSNWSLGFLMIAGCMSPIILKTHEHTHPFFVKYLWPKFWLCSAPVWILLLQFLIGIFQNPISTITFELNQYSRLEPINSWLPISTPGEYKWFTVFGFSATYLIALNLFIVPKSRAFFERLMPWLCLSATMVALLGFFQAGLTVTEPFLTKGTGQNDFIAFFPYDGHWAAFATIWSCVCISMALLMTRYHDSGNFIESMAPWYLTGGVLLAASGFLVEAHWPAIILMLAFSVIMLLFAVSFMVCSEDPHRRSIISFSLLGSLFFFAAAIHRLLQPSNEPMIQDALRQAAVDMFKDSPIFGWGIESYPALLPFYGSDLLNGHNYERASSDVLQLLSELGVFGIFFPALLLIFLILRYLMKGRRDIQLTNHFLISFAAIVPLAFCDSPLMSPAVFFSFLVVFFVALRWADLTRNRIDEVDAPRPSLVSPESERRVPFYTGPHEDRFI